MQIEAISIENFKTLKQVTIKNVPKMMVLLGANGSGKSTFFDVFSFLQDALTQNVRQALARRGGFREVVSRGESGPIKIELKFRPPGKPLATYELQIGLRDGLPYVAREVLKYRRGQHGKPWRFLDFADGRGQAISNEADYSRPDDEQEREDQKLDSPDILAIKGLGQFEKFPVAAEFRRLIENWHVSDFFIGDSRESKDAGYAEHLSTRGDNLPLVAQFLYEHHKDTFDAILKKMAMRIPGVSSVEAVETADGRIVLRFQDGAFRDPFIARYVSDGTLKMFAYLVLLNDPHPHPLLAVEEPENQLHPELLSELAEEFRSYSERGGQVFITTHSPDFVNALRLEEIFWLTKVKGFSEVSRASDDPVVRDLLREGDRPGNLWKQRIFKGAGPSGASGHSR